MVVPARPRRHRSLVTLSRLLPFPLKEAAAPGAQRTRRESQPRAWQPAMSPQCVSNVPMMFLPSPRSSSCDSISARLARAPPCCWDRGQVLVGG